MTLAFDRTHGVLHLRLSGIYAADDLDRFDEVALRFVKANGPVDMILDFSGTTALSVPAGRLARRGQMPPLCPDRRRIMVVPRPDLEDFARTFGQQQRERGYPAPAMVATLKEAQRELGLDNTARFDPVPDRTAEGAAA